MDESGAASPIHATKIDIADLHFSAGAEGYQGYVSIELRPAQDGPPIHLQFLCHAAQPRDCPSAIVTRDLIADALRQAHRMPGFRRGKRRIEVNIAQARISARP